MATATAPSREDFAKLLDEAFGGGNLQEGSVIKGKVVGIEKEFAVIDVETGDGYHASFTGVVVLR